MSVKQHIIDHNDFSTETCYLRPGESDYRGEICLNGKWDFQPVDLPADFTLGESIPELPLPKPDQWESVKLKVPSPWNINGLVDGDGIPGGDFVFYPSYPERWKHVKMGWLKRTLRVPENLGEKSILLHFEAVCGYCEVYFDGVKVGEHFDNSLPQSYLVNDFVSPGTQHELLVGIRSPELFSINNGKTKFTYPTGSFFNMNTAGIWQDVYLLGVPKVHIKDVYVQPDLSSDRLRVQVTIENQSGETANLKVNGVVKALLPFSFPEDGIQVLPHYDLDDTPVLEFPGEHIMVAADSEAVITLDTTVLGKLLQWDLENPNLYAILATLEQDGKTSDRKYERFGWREFNIKDGDFYLNDHKIQVKADSWHFMGIPQLTRRYAFAWYQALKDAGGNGVRLHAMPYPTFYLEVADEMGVCVLDESAIWASHCQFNYAELVTWERFYDHMARLIHRDRNYPSVMGWSVENEVRMALETHFPSEETIAMVREKISTLLEITRELDPTRDWISVDGSQDWDGLFPTSIIHYVQKETYQKIKSDTHKPVGVGETSIAYFGTPTQVAAFGGDLAFQSIEGRMKGVAVEAYGDLQAQLLADFSYLSVFNLAWYALKPMPLGHTQQENAPTVENGIYFSGYQEGKPGVQPERLGPYCTTFNSGYDPNLPLYAPWPMFEAIKAVFSPGGPLPSPYETEVTSPPQKPLPVIDQPVPVVFFGEQNSVYYQGLKETGVKFDEDQAGTIIFADLASLSSEQEKTLKARIDDLKSGGGTVFLAGLSPTSEHLLENLTGEKIEIFEREASSLVFAGEYANTDSLVDHFSLKELYFSEKDDYVIQRYGIHYGRQYGATAFLKACSCDWRMWNYRGEPSKTGALYRSEKELPAANALVKLIVGKARILLCTLEMRENQSVSERDRKRLWNKLMKAAGAEIRVDYGEEESYSTYTPAGQLLENAQVKAILQDFIPIVAALDEEIITAISKINLRELVKTPYLDLTAEQLDEIDQALSGILLNGKVVGAGTSTDSGKDARALEGEQIVRVLAAGFFAGHDCASMLNTDFLDGESKVVPMQGEAIIRDNFSTIWRVEKARPDGFRFSEMAFNGPKDHSISYMSFYLNSPRQLDELLSEPNIPKLYLNLETTCSLRVWLNGMAIFTQKDISTEPVKLQTPLLLRKGSNHILIKVVNLDIDYVIKAHLSSSRDDFISTLDSSVER